MKKTNTTMKQTIEMLDNVEKLKENDRIFEIPDDASVEEVLSMRKF